MASQPTDQYITVTEVAGEEVALEQIQRMADRYAWALPYCADKEVVEVACGTGQGLGLIAEVASGVTGGDIGPTMVARARAHYGDRVDVLQFSAEDMPIPDSAVDVVIIFEAIYYLPDVDAFLTECRRVLRTDGVLLIATANKDLPDFNPSPYSHAYYGVRELATILTDHGFVPDFFGNTALERVGTRQRVLRPAKSAAVRFGFMPKTMRGKRLLKRLMFGALVPMPAEISRDHRSKTDPVRVSTVDEALGYKVILCAASMPQATD